jgi:hypothetical protein
MGEKIYCPRHAIYLGDYKLLIEFTNGEIRVADLSELKNETREAYKQIADINYFKQFQISDWSLQWPNGYDIAPDYLYEISQPVEIKAVS